jgi:flagellin
MSDAIILGAATQQNLLSLQNINQQLSSTQGHLATGLKVASAVDNAVLFFQAQSLTNRATDLSTRKDNIDQGVSSLTTATQGIQSAISILQQMQGLLQSAKTETATQRKSAATQFNTLSVQLNQLLNDSSYQGLNLVNSSTSNLTLQFSDATASTLKISGQNLLMSVLLGKATVSYDKNGIQTGHSAGSGYSAYNAYTGSSHSAGSGHSVGSGFSNLARQAYNANISGGSGHSSASGFSAAFAASQVATTSHNSAGSGFSAGSKGGAGTGFSTVSLTKYANVAWTGGTTAGSGHSKGSSFSAYALVAHATYSAGSGHSSGSGFSAYEKVAYTGYSAGSTHSAGSGFSTTNTINVKASVQATAFAGVTFSTAVSTNKISAFDTVYNALNAAISTAQAAAQSLGANVSLLQTRLSFTASYITTLNGGSSKLTVADVNLESTNLVTLQTRQQLAIQSLSIATQSEQAVLRLFH